MKKCPYCAELIKVEAVKCRFCGGEQLSSEPSDSSMTVDTVTLSRDDRARTQEEEQYGAKTGEKVKKRKRIGFFPLLLIVFAALIVIGYIASRTSSPPKSPPLGLIKQDIPKEAEIEGPPKEASQFFYARTKCNIRGGPGTKYPIVGKAEKGQKLEYVSLEGNWYRLKVARDEPQKWVHKSVVTLPEQIQVPKAPEAVTQIRVKGQTIKAGDLADDVFKILRPEDMQAQEIAKDSNNPRSTVVTKYYRVEGKTFALLLKRIKDPGPYRVEKIILGKLPPKSETEGKAIHKFFYVGGHKRFSTIPMWSTYGGASRGAYQVAMVRDGQKVEAIAVEKYKGVKFYKVKTSEGKIGWIDEIFLTEKKQ